MPSKAISALDTANAIGSADLIPIVQGGVNKKASQAVLMGKWQNIAYSADNFSANAGAWDVYGIEHLQMDQQTLAYFLQGNNMTVAFAIGSSSVSGGPGSLRIAIPLGKTAAGAYFNTVFAKDNGNVVAALARTAGSQYILIELASGAAWADSNNNTYVRGQISFPVV